MKTVTVQYLGELRVEATHEQSGSSLITDGPLDNEGQGESFSPTDLLATAILTSMVTMMGAAARSHQLDPGRVSGSVVKKMIDKPRRVAALEVVLSMEGHQLDEKGKGILEASALSCPVTRSIHPDIQLILTFQYQ
ncbi:MAG: OsmC family protein [Bacteroidia bacterium]|nr:OsmC family protein [Bacteroidia bacterium]